MLLLSIVFPMPSIFCLSKVTSKLAKVEKGSNIEHNTAIALLYRGGILVAAYAIPANDDKDKPFTHPKTIFDELLSFSDAEKMLHFIHKPEFRS